MSDQLGVSIKRIVFKEIVAGDRRKFIAQSNDTQNGGGARDLRFSPSFKFLPVFKRMFTRIDEKGIAIGNFHWYENNEEISRVGAIHPPTNARANECRIGNVDKCLPNAPEEESELTFLVLIQDNNNKVWASFTTQEALSKEWHQGVANSILSSHRRKRNRKTSTAGYIDFELEEEYCNNDK